MKGQGLRLSIQLKLTALVAGMVLLTVAGLSLAAYVFVRRTLAEQSSERLVAVASDRQKLLVSYLKVQEERVRLIASRRLWREFLTNIADGQTPSENLRRETQASLEDALRSVSGLRAIWITDLRGQVVLGTDPVMVGRDFAGTEEFRRGLAGVSLVIEDDDPSDDTLTMVSPALVASNRVVGTLFVVMAQQSIVDLVADRTGLGDSGGVMLGVANGDRIRYLLRGVSGTLPREVEKKQVPAMAAAVVGEAGVMKTEDYRGKKVLAAFRPVGYHGWGVVAKMDVAEVYAPIRELRNMFLVMEVLIFLVVLLASYWAARRFSRPLLRLTKMADSIAKGGLQAQVVVESNDEIGQLGETFNKMSEELSHSYALLEERVAQRTAELKAERDLMQGLMDTIPDFIYFKDSQSRFLRVGKAKAEEVGAKDPAELVGKSDFDFFPADEARVRFEDEQRIIRTGQPIIAQEEREHWPDGTEHWCSSTKLPLRDTHGNIIGTLGISRDITDRKRAEEELNRYFELSPDLFCIADYDGHFRRLSPAWSAVFGFTAEELMAQPFLDFVHPDDRAATVKEYEKILHGSRVIHFENRYRCKDGSYRWLQWNSIPVPEQKLIHAVARDVSEHKRAQELLARFADALNKKNLELQEDLKLAREVHQVFVQHEYPIFPAGAPPERNALRFAHRYLPTSALGGDFFDIFPVSDSEAGILMCDVMGHGMRAALVTSIVRGLMEKYHGDAGDPGLFLGDINRALLANLKKCSATIFATACYLVVDVRTGRVRGAGAGHPAPLVLRSGTKEVERLPVAQQPAAPALGLIADAVYQTSTHVLGARDRILLYTDGIYEVENKEGQEFGLTGLETVARRQVSASNLDLLDEVLLASRAHSASGDFLDDVCLLSVELTAPTG